MHMRDLKSLDANALNAKLGQLRLELAIEKRKISSTGVQSKKGKVREMRRTIAQILTILKERGVTV